MPVRSAFNEFQWLASAGSAAAGVAVTPGNNAYGSYVQLISGATLTEDAFGIELHLVAVAVSGSARDCMVKLAVDPAGGTSFAGNDIGVDIACSCASAIAANGVGISYFFPIRFRAGSSIGVAMSVNNATVGTGSAYCRLPWKPTHPELVPRTGTAIRTYGSVPASSSGTTITPNSAGGKSAFVQLGTIAAGDFPWAWSLGVCCNNAVMSNNPSAWDLALGSSTTVNRVIVLDDLVAVSASETLTRVASCVYAQGNPGDLVLARAGGPAASPTGMSAAAYGVVG